VNARRLAAALALAALALPWPASAQFGIGNGITYFLANARYAEMEKAAEAEAAKRATPGAWPLAPLCYAHWKVKRYARLFDCIERLEARIQAGDRNMRHEDASMVSGSDISALPAMLRANAWLELGDNARALEEARRGLASIPRSSSLSFFSPVVYRLEMVPVAAIAAWQLGDRAAADQYFEELKGITVGYVGSGQFRNLREYQLARVYMIRGDYAKALEHAREEHLKLGAAIASFLITSREGDDSLHTAFELGKRFMVGKSLAETGKRDEAKQGLDVLLAMRRLPDQGDIHWPALYERGRIAEAEGDRAGAIGFYLRAIEVIDGQRASINTEASKIGFVGDKQQVYAQAIALLVRENRAAEAFDYVERSKSRALVDLLASKRDFAVSGIDALKTQQVLAQLDAANQAARVDEGALRPVAASGQDTGMRSLQVARAEVQGVSAELATLVSVSSVPVAELRALLGADETLVEYYYQGAGELYAFVLGGAGLAVAKLEAAGLEEQVQALRRAIEEPGSAAWQAPSRALYEKLWRPVEALVTTPNAVVVAHGALHYLPFAALQRGDGAFLTDRVGLRFLPAASVLKFLRPATPGREAQLLVLGNPDLDDPKLDLQFADGEARLVAGMTAGSRLLLRKDASETTFKKSAGVFSRLHFASHGKFRSDEPLGSGLLLAKDADNDGLLTVGELYSMQLDADLVTLSACETGLGKVANGDDVVGLTRGFLFAGSRSIVASLWSVDDRATATLMKAFYDNLATHPKREALRRAQASARQEFPHPFFWAAFQLTGRGD
jgi:CHAT domain-containing protein